MSEVILVNEQDEQTGVMEKLEAHQKALLHRAFSIFIFNSKGEMLLQQRAAGKYHNPGLWTNACCSHPMPGEATLPAAKRRLQEELGFTTSLEKVFEFTYKAAFDNGLTEYEFDHVFSGDYNGEININRSEVEDYCYKTFDEIDETLNTHPQKYTAWFKIAFPEIRKIKTGHGQLKFEG
ncbi:MAG: isopentenyl-diphosphate Delta-isomerase [Ginsengibacter sp.]